MEQCPKQIIIEKFTQERNLQPGQLLCFGDGSTEIEYMNKIGGVCVGVLIPDRSHYEYQGHFTIEQKRRRLINAGAHILVPDFHYASKLVETICSELK